MRHQRLVSFFEDRSKGLTLLTFFSIKIALAAPKMMCLDTYRIFIDALLYRHSVKGNNQDPEITGTIASSVLNLPSGYTDLYLLAEFSRIG